MSFWEIVKQVCAAFGAEVARRWSVSWKTRPLSAAIKSERRLIKKRYAQLGERYYDKCAEGIIDDGALAYLVRDINTSRARMEEYAAEIAELRQKPAKPIKPAKAAPDPAPVPILTAETPGAVPAEAPDAPDTPDTSVTEASPDEA